MLTDGGNNEVTYMTKLFKKNKLFALVLALMLLFSCFGWLGANVRAAATSTEVELLTIALSHLQQRVDELETAIDAKADEETVNAKITELEEAIVAAEEAAKAYADEQDEALKNELTAAIESAKTELANAIQAKADAEAVNAKIAELEAAVAATTNELSDLKQKTEELEDKNDELQTLLISVCVVSSVTFGGFGIFVVLFFIQRSRLRRHRSEKI